MAKKIIIKIEDYSIEDVKYIRHMEGSDSLTLCYEKGKGRYGAFTAIPKDVRDVIESFFSNIESVKE